MESKFNPITTEDEARIIAFDDFEKGEQQTELDRLHVRALIENTQTIYDKASAEQSQEMKEDLLRAIELMEAVRAEGGAALIVGGYARDEVLRNLGEEITSKDLDIEVYGIPVD